jgi:hypothetical protein
VWFVLVYLVLCLLGLVVRVGKFFVVFVVLYIEHINPPDCGIWWNRGGDDQSHYLVE